MKSILTRLQRSPFRQKFTLTVQDKKYLRQKGLETIHDHAYKFLTERLQHCPVNDGTQTPWQGHPVFVAQHATATCCRGCIERWYKIPKHKHLTEEELLFLQAIIIEWITQHDDQKIIYLVRRD